MIASQFAPPFMFSGVAVALPAMAAELHAGATSMSLIETLFLAGSVTFVLPAGRFSDTWDKRSLYKIGLIAFGVMSLLIAVLSSMPLILVLRFFQGITSAIFGATGLAIMAEIVPQEQRGRFFGRAIGATYAGLTVGPITAGFLVDIWGWRAVFFGGAIPLLAAFILVQWIMPSSWAQPKNWRTVLGTFGNIRELLRDRILRDALLVQSLLYMNAYTSIFMLSIYLQITLGTAAKTSGQIIAIGSVLMAVMAPVSGMLSDRIRPRTISCFGIGCILVAVLLARTMGAETDPFFVAVVLGFQGVGFAFFSSPNMTIIMNSVPSSAVGMASALGAQSRSVGMVSGMLATGLLISFYLGNAPIAENPLRFLNAMHTALTVLAAATFAALVLALMRSRGASTELNIPRV